MAIPVSLMGSFIVLKYMGFTINTFTLLALSLSIGIVVDDAIMVLENIVRYFEQGMGKVKASLIGAREITGAALASSVAILAIFIPVIFMDGIVGKFFFQFGVTMSVTVLISLLEALTLAPMRCSQFLQASHESKIGSKMNHFMDGLSKRYLRVLSIALQYKGRVLIGAVIIFALSLFVMLGVKQEFVPAQDQNRFNISLQTPMGSSLEFTSNKFKEAEAVLRARPEIESVMATVGGFQGGLVNQGFMMIMLKPAKGRISHTELMNWARTELKKIKGLKRVSVSDPSLQSFGSGKGMPVQFQVQGPDWEKLSALSQSLMDKMNSSGLMVDVDTDYNPNMPEERVVPDRDAAAKRGVTISNISNTISTLFGSSLVGKYTNSSYHRNDIRLKLDMESAKDSSNIKNLSVRNNRGEMIPFSEVVKLEPGKTLLTIGRYNRERSISLFSNIAPGKTQKDALAFIDQTSHELLPEGYHIVYSGNAQTSSESSNSLLIALALGILVAYMVLASQFNSFIHPVTVLLALPFSITGALLALWITGITLNIYSMIGLLLLMGIVKKNSILLVDFTNQRREEGMEIHEALLAACPLRLRPILMTSCATIAAAIPSALSIGPGSETTRPMSVVVIGGVLVSTVLTLIVVPCAYSLFSRFENRQYKRELAEAIAEIEAAKA
jgi:HAE1 family hydrophobic/amphiphilic exporter-1